MAAVGIILNVCTRSTVDTSEASNVTAGPRLAKGREVKL